MTERFHPLLSPDAALPISFPGISPGIQGKAEKQAPCHQPQPLLPGEACALPRHPLVARLRGESFQQEVPDTARLVYQPAVPGRTPQSPPQIQDLSCSARTTSAPRAATGQKSSLLEGRHHFSPLHPKIQGLRPGRAEAAPPPRGAPPPGGTALGSRGWGARTNNAAGKIRGPPRPPRSWSAARRLLAPRD